MFEFSLFHFIIVDGKKLVIGFMGGKFLELWVQYWNWN